MIFTVLDYMFACLLFDLVLLNNLSYLAPFQRTHSNNVAQAFELVAGNDSRGVGDGLHELGDRLMTSLVKRCVLRHSVVRWLIFLAAAA